ncbi:Protein FAM214A [Mytilus edulis]|uniref:Protein FAM214A n=1 Tax=Mytilus edulis TaxID=6550 RepID=A0A8S3PN04_MYTED|nr:Protein FAM214A [Mytilus edulis]
MFITATGLPTRSSPVSIHGNTATGLPTRSSPVSIHGNTATGLPTRSSLVSIHGNTATGLPTRSSLVSIHGNTATGLPTRSSPVSIHGNTATGLPTRSSLVSIHGNTATGLPTRSSPVSIHGNTATGLPTRSSPVSIHGNTAQGLVRHPTKRKSSGGRFDYDNTLISTKAIKNALSCSKLALQSESSTDHEESQKVLSTSAPASTNCLLGNFEESVLNGRIEPIGVVEGFTAEIGAGGSFCPKHITLPVTAYFFQLSDDNAPSPYLLDTIELYKLKTPHLRGDISQIPTPIYSSTPAPVKPVQKQIPRPIPQRKPDIKKSKKTVSSVLPNNTIKQAFQHFCNMKAAPDTMDELIKYTDTYFENTFKTLEAFALHAGRKTIDESDVELLMRRQGFITEKQPLNVLVENILPLELRQEIIPMARANNVIEPL